MSNSRVLRIRIPWGDHIAMGQGKAALLEAIHETGSISAAGRQLGMSYRKAWAMIHDMNQYFRSPVVEAAKGGAQGGGAQVTELGLEALYIYRGIQTLAWKAIEGEVMAFRDLLKPEESALQNENNILKN